MGENQLGYSVRKLTPYIFRVAITNRRIVSLNDDPFGGLPTVTFRYRPSGSRHWRLRTVPVLAFIHRFCSMFCRVGL